MTKETESINRFLVFYELELNPKQHKAYKRPLHINERNK